MSVYVESGIEFDLTRAIRVIEYENLFAGLPGAPPGQRNTFWPGVDFCIEDSAGEFIWLDSEKLGTVANNPEKERGNRRSFHCKMKSQPFAQEMRGKFLGTSSFFAWDGRPLPVLVNFILLFEPPHPLDAALVLAFSNSMKSQLMPPKVLSWRSRIHVSALTLAEWNMRFPDYPARIL